MIKRNLAKAIISSIIILLPIVFGIISWDSLPDVITTHFGADGVPDGTSGKGFAVFGVPLVMLTLHWICIIATLFTNRKREQNDKVYGMMFFIMPMISTFVSVLIYSTAFNYTLHLGSFVSILFGVTFMVMGNYMPKVTRNRTMGIKIKWTLASDANWAATHRFGGKVWFFGGFIIMLGAFLPLNALIIAFFFVTLLLVLIPTVYSYVFYKKQLARGDIKTEVSLVKKSDKIIGIVVSTIIVTILVGVGILMFTGEVTATLGENALEIGATYYKESVVKYDDIDYIEYRESGDLGARQYGYGSARLALGIFASDELGSYTRYTYTAPSAYILIKSGDKTLVVGLESDAATKALYDELAERIGK